MFIIKYTNAWEDEYYLEEMVPRVEVPPSQDSSPATGASPTGEEGACAVASALYEGCPVTHNEPNGEDWEQDEACGWNYEACDESEEYDFPEDEGDYRDEEDWQHPDEKYEAMAYRTGFGSKHTRKAAFHSATQEDRWENYETNKMFEADGFDDVSVVEARIAMDRAFRAAMSDARDARKNERLRQQEHTVDLHVSELYKSIGVTTGRTPGFERGGQFEHYYNAIGRKDCYAPVQKLEFVHAKKTETLGAFVKAMRRLRADPQQPLVRVDAEMLDLDVFKGLSGTDFGLVKEDRVKRV
jgi:hypothetical protein